MIKRSDGIPSVAIGRITASEIDVKSGKAKNLEIDFGGDVAKKLAAVQNMLQASSQVAPCAPVLPVSQACQDDGITAIQIFPDAGHLKNGTSKRVVPIHSKLIAPSASLIS